MGKSCFCRRPLLFLFMFGIVLERVGFLGLRMYVFLFVHKFRLRWVTTNGIFVKIAAGLRGSGSSQLGAFTKTVGVHGRIFMNTYGFYDNFGFSFFRENFEFPRNLVGFTKTSGFHDTSGFSWKLGVCYENLGCSRKLGLATETWLFWENIHLQEGWVFRKT